MQKDESKGMGDEYVSVEHIFLAMMKYADRTLKELFRQYSISRDSFLQALFYGAGKSAGWSVTIRRQPMTLWKNMV